MSIDHIHLGSARPQTSFRRSAPSASEFFSSLLEQSHSRLPQTASDSVAAARTNTSASDTLHLYRIFSECSGAPSKARLSRSRATVTAEDGAEAYAYPKPESGCLFAYRGDSKK